MARHLRPKLITPDTLRAVDREYRDLVMSLRALASLLHEPDGGTAASRPDDEGEPDGHGKAWEPVLANILDAELNQLAVLMGDVTAALRVENEVIGPVRHIDLSRVLETAVRRAGSRVLVAVADPVRVAAHPEIVSQAVSSALSLALRSADGRVTAVTRRRGDDGVVVITVPGDEQYWGRLDPRLALLRKIVAAEGGHAGVQHRPGFIVLTLSFPTVKPQRALRPA